MNVYHDPASFGLETIGEIEWSDGSYQFDLTVVWRRTDGVFVYAEDAGCSCPSPFEDTTPADLIEIASLADFTSHLETRIANISGYDPDPRAAVAELLERMHTAGAR
jgi:hypothetical protein